MTILYFSRRFLPLFLLSILLPSCTEEKKEDKLPHYQPDIVKTSNALGITWLKEQLEKSPGENICVAPFPLIMMSSALACGAEGETKEQLWKFAASSLCRNGSLPASFNEPSYLYHIRQLNQQFKKDMPGYVLYNGLYANKNLDILSTYKKLVRKNLDMNIDSADFSKRPEKIIDKINTQISEFTHGLVQEGLSPDSITPDTSYIMFSVMGFERYWGNIFQKELTKEDKFYSESPASETMVPFMQQKINSFRETEKYTIIWLDYIESTARFIVILPDKNTNIKQFVQGMKSDSFQEYITLMNSPQKEWENEDKTGKTRNLFLPKFELLTPSFNCIPILFQKGATDCFINGKADFSRMMQPSYNIKSIMQKNYLQIDEIGTKAYSVTHLEWESCDLPEMRKDIKVNRPFLCFIMDAKTNMVLFAAAINDPAKTKNAPPLVAIDGTLP